MDAKRMRRGSALLVAVIAVMVLAGLAATVVTFSSAVQRENVAEEQSTRALYVADAGMSLAINSIRNDNYDPTADLQQVGASDAPQAFSGGEYWYQIVNNHDSTLTVTATGRVGNQTTATEAILQTSDDGVYSSALFAGNSSGDPLYDMKFGGVGNQADQINGNIYSGGNILVAGNAQVNGLMRAKGAISGGSGETGKSMPIPDLAAMDYEHTADFNVKSLFGTATYKSHSTLGGKAWQVVESNPAHIFRKNPSDRATNINATPKDDYFLEDPYETVSTSSVVDAAHGTHITLSGHDSNVGVNGSHKVYFIDGNLWIHNNNIYSFTLFNSGSDTVQVTFVVKGNIYISDNILYQGTRPDGLALIAMKDPNYADSGSIYFGDPTFGTLEQMDSFMYAENDFLDNNLSASGSARVTVNGNMTAGDQVRINRDYGNQHSKLTVNFDNRLETGVVTLPGLPGTQAGDSNWNVVSWRIVAAQ